MPRVLKAATVYIDQDNMVQIKADIPNIPMPVAEVQDPLPDIPPEEIAQDIVKKAEEEADFILRHTDVESNAILSRAKEEAKDIVLKEQIHQEQEGQRIREESRSEGYQQGIDDAMAEAERIRSEAQAVLDAAIQERDETRKAVEPDTVNLIINIVEKLVGNVVSINPTVVVSLIRQGFAGATLSGQVTVRVSEADYPEVVLHKEVLEAAVGGTAEVEIVRDLSLGATDCVIDTPFGGIDVSLTPQFEALRENLIFLLEHRE